ncbi:MAG TPA: MBL fold metallo-hydrolase, partial [Symbiobacteriaceae bacterium]|nr:MBL fold metallo-hydrolase [Symbiobacteriaceae bacterium]
MSPLSQGLDFIQIPIPTPWPVVGPIHAYLIKQDPVTLIDTGVNDEPSRAALLAGLQAAGVAVTDIKRILVTHAHLDHMGQAAWLQAESGAEVWVHPDETGKLATPPWWHEGRAVALQHAGVPQETAALMDRYWRTGRRLALPLERW